MMERPLKQALTEALDIFRDAMRPFVVRNLKRVQGAKVEELISQAVSPDRKDRLLSEISSGRSSEQILDIADFYSIVRRYWSQAFRSLFPARSSPQATLSAIVEARNRVSHPSSEDIELSFALESMQNISYMLSLMNAPEESNVVNEIRERIKPYEVQAHKFVQGGRDVYAFSLDLETLDRLLPDRVEDRLVRDANRPLTPNHARAIQEYLVKKDNWLLGTLLLGIAPEAIEFEPHITRSGDAMNIGILRIKDTSVRAIKMFDGQHRRRAIKEALLELSQSERMQSRLKTLRESSLPIMLYVEDSIPALQQMFADAAQTRRIEQNTLTRFDQGSAFNLAAMWLAENSDLFGGRVEMERPSVSRNNENIVAINQLAAALKCIEVGTEGRVSQVRNQDFLSDLDALNERCLTWSDDFMPAARTEYDQLIGGEIDSADIPAQRSTTMAFNATVIRIFAGCYFRWRQYGLPWEKLAQFLRESSFEVDGNTPSLLQEAGVVAAGGTSPMSGRRQVENAVQFIVERAKRHSGGK